MAVRRTAEVEHDEEAQSHPRAGDDLRHRVGRLVGALGGGLGAQHQQRDPAKTGRRADRDRETSLDRPQPSQARAQALTPVLRSGVAMAKRSREGRGGLGVGVGRDWAGWGR